MHLCLFGCVCVRVCAHVCIMCMCLCKHMHLYCTEWFLRGWTSFIFQIGLTPFKCKNWFWFYHGWTRSGGIQRSLPAPGSSHSTTQPVYQRAPARTSDQRPQTAYVTSVMPWQAATREQWQGGVRTLYGRKQWGEDQKSGRLPTHTSVGRGNKKAEVVRAVFSKDLRAGNTWEREDVFSPGTRS